MSTDTTKRASFTVHDGLRIQATQLAEWKAKLNAETFYHLSERVAEANAVLTPENSGYDVLRGGFLDESIFNFHPNR